MEQKADISRQLATAPIGKLLLKLAIPTVLAQLVNLLYNIVDRIYIGHMPGVGSTALTALGLCFPIICAVGAFTALIAQGGAPRAAIQMGRGASELAEKIMGSCLTCLVVAAAALTAALQFWGEELLWLFGASENTIGYSMEYARIYVGGSIFAMLSLGMNAFITTQGFAKEGMLSVVIGAVVNIALDPLFIFAFGMGVSGAAIATVIAQAASALWVLLFLCGKRSKLRVRRENLVPTARVMLPCLALGLSPFIMQITEALINVAFNSSLQRYGGDVAVGTMTVASTVMQMIWLPANGIGQGAQPIISYNYGARNPKRVKAAVRTMAVAKAAFLVFFWIAVECFPRLFMSIFTGNEALLANSGLLRVYMAVLGLFSIQSVTQQTFTATGKAKASLFIACLRKVIMMVPLIYILPSLFEDKVFAIFLAEPLSDIVSISASAILFHLVFVREMRRMERLPEQA